MNATFLAKPTVPAPGELAAPRPHRPRLDRRRPLTEAQRDMASRFLPLARLLAKPLKAQFPRWSDEFESMACIALVEAARSYNPSKKVKFATFAQYRIRFALRDVGPSMNAIGWDGEGDQPKVAQLTPYSERRGRVLVARQPGRVGFDMERAELIEELLRRIPRKHADVCRMYYLEGMTQQEIGDRMGCSQTEITRLHRCAMQLLSDPCKPQPQATGRRRRAKPFRASRPRTLRASESVN